MPFIRTTRISTAITDACHHSALLSARNLYQGQHACDQAEQVIHQCLEIPGQVRWPIRLAETRVDLGLAAAGEGEIDEACDLGRQALASERKSGSTLGRVAELDAVLMRGHPDVGEVVDLHEQVQAARRALT